MNKELIILVEEAPEGGFLARGGGHTILSKAGNLRQLRDEISDLFLRLRVGTTISQPVVSGWLTLGNRCRGANLNR